MALTPSRRKEIYEAAITIGKLIKYEGAGTVEFIWDEIEKRFYFLEVNTRLQVEHPVTEAVTGLDLVELQIQVALGKSLKDLKMTSKGHAIEVRLCAEDPLNNFAPCTGNVLLWKHPLYNNFNHFDSIKQYPRFDTGVKTNSSISVFYDPMYQFS